VDRTVVDHMVVVEDIRMEAVDIPPITVVRIMADIPEEVSVAIRYLVPSIF